MITLLPVKRFSSKFDRHHFLLAYSGGKKICITLAFSQKGDMREVLFDRLTMNVCEILQNL